MKTCALAGNSMGGTWGVWYALARPARVRRLALLGSAPLLPGTRPPLPLRVTAAPLLGDLPPRVVKPNRKLLVRLLASMGEKDTIVRYPDLIESLVAAARDPIASAANLAELRAVISPFRFRPSARIDPDELRRLGVPTLLIWGDRDPVGTVEAARATARLVPQAQLEVLPAGHVPYLGPRASVRARVHVRPLAMSRGLAEWSASRSSAGSKSPSARPSTPSPTAPTGPRTGRGSCGSIPPNRIIKQTRP